MSARWAVHATRNFERNLESIRLFLADLEETEAPRTFDRLVEKLLDEVIPNLEQFPRLGVDFLARKSHSLESTLKIKAIQAKLGEGSSIREYIVGDYIVLYAVSTNRVDLLAIKHHRQLSFDLRGHWGT
ncbi:MAG: type II toxin-antitoxin system RelE/ParE family toxin [Polyangiaceae bacterium]|nr:type II toxin-antitoxin system RelE/ParE family toxin [Polyangiaceae bacterium]